MATEKVNRISNFLQKNVLEPPTSSKGKLLPCRVIRLVRIGVDGTQGGDAGTWVVKKDFNVEDNARRILDHAQGEADEMEDAVRFELQAYHDSEVPSASKQTPTDTITLRCVGAKKRRGEFDPTGLGEFTENANNAGERSQLMRHREAEVGTNLKGFVANMDTMIRQVRDLSDRLDKANDRIEKMQDERLEMIKAHEKSLSEAKQRELDHMKAVNAERRKDELLGKAAMLVPVLANYIAGHTIIPDASSSAFKDTAKQFIDKLAKNGKIGKLQQILSAEEMISFASLVDALMQDERVIEAQKAMQEKRIEAVAENPAALARAQQSGVIGPVPG